MSVPNVDLRGKGALITGGGSGICLSFVKHLYASGCNILICDIRLHKEASAWLDGIKNLSTAPARVAFHKTDVTDWKQLEDTFHAFKKEFGGVPDLVCPGAGVYEPSVNNFWNDQDTDHYLILRINLEHPIKLSRLAIRHMVGANKPGIILLISSTGAQKSSIITPLYQAAKHGISNFTRCMGPLHDLKSPHPPSSQTPNTGPNEASRTGIRVIAIAPGPTLSPLFLENPLALRFIDLEKDRLCEVDEVARAMMAVCFDKERFQPGTVLEVTHPNRWREVHLLNDPGPEAIGYTSRKDDAIVDVTQAIEADRMGKK